MSRLLSQKILSQIFTPVVSQKITLDDTLLLKKQLFVIADDSAFTSIPDWTEHFVTKRNEAKKNRAVTDSPTASPLAARHEVKLMFAILNAMATFDDSPPPQGVPSPIDLHTKTKQSDAFRPSPISGSSEMEPN
jgi:hypothetical protein